MDSIDSLPRPEPIQQGAIPTVSSAIATSARADQASPQAVAAASHILISLDSAPEACVSLGPVLLAGFAAQDDVACAHGALSLLVSGIDNGGTARVGPDGLSALAGFAMALAFDPSALPPSLAGVRHFREKLADLVVALAMAGWPSTWDSFVDDVVAAAEEREDPAMAMAILATFTARLGSATSFKPTSSTPTHVLERCAELKAAWAAVESQVLSTILTVTIAGMEEGSDAGPAGLAALDPGLALIDLTRVPYELSSTVIALLTASLEAPGAARKHALAALQTLTGRSGNKALVPIILSAFDHLEALFAPISNAPPPLQDWDAHEFCFLLVDTLVELGLIALASHRSARFDPDRAVPLHDAFPEYISAMASLVGHDSIRIQVGIPTLLASLLRSALVDRSEIPSSDLVSQILDAAIHYYTLPLPDPETDQGILAATEYEDELELKRVLAKLRDGSDALLAEVGKGHGPHALSFAASFVSYALNAATELDLPKIDLHLAAAARTLLAVLSSVPGDTLVQPRNTGDDDDDDFAISVEIRPQTDAKDRAAARQDFQNLLELVLSFLESIQDSHLWIPPLIEHVVSMVAAFFGYLRTIPDMLPPVFNALFSLVTLRSNSATEKYAPLDPSQESLGVFEVRRRAAQELAMLALNVGELLTPLLPQLQSEVQDLLDAGALLPFETPVLYTSLLLLAEEHKETRDSLLQSILATVIPVWTSPEFSAATASPEAFASALGLDSEDGVHSPDSLAFRNSVYHAVSVVEVAFTYSRGWGSDLLASILASILDPLASLLCSLQGVLDPNALDAFPPFLRPAFLTPHPHITREMDKGWTSPAVPSLLLHHGIVPSEETQEAEDSGLGNLSPALRSSGMDPDGGYNPNRLVPGVRAYFASPAVLLQWWLHAVHGSATLTLKCTMDFSDIVFEIPAFASALSAVVIDAVPTLSVHALCIMITHVVVALRNRIPEHLRIDFLHPFYYSFVEAMLSRLSSEWDDVSSGQLAATLSSRFGDEVAVSEESRHVNALSKLTYTFGTQLRTVSSRIARRSGDPHFLTVEPMRSLFVNTVVTMLWWPAPAVQRLCVTLVLRVVKVFAAEDDFGSLVPRLMEGLLNTLSYVQTDYDGVTVIHSLADAYLVLAPYHLDILHTVFQNAPGVDADAIARTESAISAAPANKTTATAHQAFTELLKSVTSCNVARNLHQSSAKVEGVLEGTYVAPILIS